MGGFFVQRKVPGNIKKAFVDRIDVDVVGADVLEIDVVDLGGNIHVLRHLRGSRNEIDFFTGLSAVIFELLEDFEEAWSTGNAERFEARGHGEADRFFSAAGVGDDEVCGQRV